MKSVADIVTNNVLKPLKLTETGWYGEINEKLVDVIRKPNDVNWITSKSTDGDKMNMYESQRDLDYLADVRKFGDTIMTCLLNY